MTVSATFPLVGVAYVAPGDIPEDDGLPKEPSENAQHKAEGLSRFIEQYKRKPRLESLACAYLNQIQVLETAIFEIINERSVASAVGTQLDVIGSIVGQERAGLSDADYRIFINARIAINTSDGQADDMLSALASTVGGSPTVSFTDYPPASFRISLKTDIGSTDPDVVFLLMLAARPAGVRMLFSFTRNSEATTFTVKAHGTTSDASKGISTHASPSNGRLASSKG